jgi:hypothetical protein
MGNTSAPTNTPTTLKEPYATDGGAGKLVED